MKVKFEKRVFLSAWVLALAVVIIFSGCNKPEDKQLLTNQLTKIRVASSPQPSLGLIHVALEKDFFKEEGLELEVTEFTAGKLALQALIGGSLDLTFAAELPVTLATLNGEDLSILTKLNETRGGFPMILRKDKDSEFKADEYFARSRKIATSIGGGPEFFTFDFFRKNNIEPSQYEVVGMKPQDLPIALARGDVDGIAIFEPFAYFAIEQTGADNVHIIKDEGLYSETMILVAKPEWAQQNTQVVINFLKALKKAEDFILNNKEKSVEIISLATKLDEKVLSDIWDTFTFSLGLDERLIQVMEGEAKWAIETGKVLENKELPNFGDIIFDGPLWRVSPKTIKFD